MTDLAAAQDLAWRIDPAHMISHLTGRSKSKSTDYAALRKQVRLYPHTKLLGRKFAEAVMGVSPRQIWQIGPRYGKTLTASIAGPVWALDLDPGMEVILASYGDDLAQRNGRAARNMLIEHSDILDARISKDSTSVDRWNTTQGGGVRAAGVGSALTGFGGDLAIIDDPFKNWEEAQSALRRELVWDWFRSVLWTRLQGARTPVLVVATRWHKEDLSGMLIREDRERVRRGEPPMWEIVHLPTIADGGEKGVADPLGREDGDPLCPELFPLETVMEQREVLGSQIHRAMHQQDPTDPEGGIFKREWWRFWDATPDPARIWSWWSSWDMNFKEGSDSSHVVGQVWCRAGADHYLIDQVRGRWSYVVAKGQMRALLSRYPQITTILVEDKANGPAIMSDLGNQFAGFRAVTPQGSKESRAHAVAAIPESGHVVLPAPGIKPWVEGFIDELADFPNADNDDQVDATSQYLLHAGGVFAAKKMAYGRSRLNR